MNKKAVKTTPRSLLGVSTANEGTEATGAEPTLAQNSLARSSAATAVGVLRIVVGPDGKPADISFGATSLTSSEISHAYAWGPAMVPIAGRIGRALAMKRIGLPINDSVLTLLRGGEACGFRDAILDKIPKNQKGLRQDVTKKSAIAWFTKLFEIAHSGVAPFGFVNDTVLWRVSPADFDHGQGGCIKRVVITRGTIDCDSTKHGPEEFDRVIEEFRSLRADFGDAIAESVEQGASDFCRAMKNARCLTENPFKVADEVLAKYHGKKLPCFDMHLVSLIHPRRWYVDEDYGWSNLHTRIQGLATQAARYSTPSSRRHRRLHVVARDMRRESLHMLYLADVMLDALKHKLDSRVLLVDPEKIEYRADVPMIKNALLMDTAAFSMKGGHHGVIISNERPYFLLREGGHFKPAWGVYQIPSEHIQACYYYMRHNFQNLWNDAEFQDRPTEVWRIPKLLRHLSTLLANTDEATQLGGKLHAHNTFRPRYFSMETWEDTGKLVAELQALLNLVPSRRSGDPVDEDLEEDTFVEAFDTQCEQKNRN